MTGRRRPHRRQVLRLGLGGLLAAAGCDWEELLDEPGPPPAEPAAEEARPAPPAEELRAEAVRQGIASLTAECRQHAGGDWDKWHADLERFRADLKARIDAARPNNPNAESPFEARCPVLEAAGDPPLFESNPAWYLKHLVEPSRVERFRRELPVAVVSQWLKSKNIDLIFMPVPKMTEVYPHRVAGPCPEHRIIAPHLRRVLLELLRRDVEVVDLLPVFLADPQQDTSPLYLPDDPHWAPRAWEIAARVLCGRLQRYEFARLMSEGRRLFTATETPWVERGAAYLALTADQQRRAERAYPKTRPVVTFEPPTPGVTWTDSPVLLIGDSYNHGLVELIALGLNCPVAIHTGGGQTTQAIREAVRNRHLLAGRKVVLWVVCNTALAEPDWDLPPVLTAGERR